MIHRRHLYLGALERSKAALDDHQAFVAHGGIFKTDGVVVGLNYPFTIVLGRLTNRTPVDTDKARFGYS